uniref:Charged multivesicular body protein 5 n=1 Tax=Triticum urartu TaxID=4572 RepID=A0A8R7NXQ2_TRIUA
MTAMKAANKELKGMMKTVRIEDIDSMQDEMMDLMDVSNEIQETLGRSYSVPDDIDEEELICSWPFLDDSNTRYYHPKVTESNSLPYSDNQPGTTRQFKFCS